MGYVYENVRRIRLSLERLDENGRALLGAFRRAAESEGWSNREIDSVVIRAAMAGDYHDAVRVLREYVCEPESFLRYHRAGSGTRTAVLDLSLADNR